MAAELLGQEPVDILVSDVEMPELDGTELAIMAISGAGQEPAKTDHVPLVILVTGLEMDDLRIQALQHAPKVVAVFQKPVDLDVLEAAVSCAASGDAEGARLLAMGCRR